MLYLAISLEIISKIILLADYFNMEVERIGTMHKVYTVQDTPQKF